MATVVGTINPPRRRRSIRRVLWDRELEHYPERPARFTYLGIVVASTILLYYELYVAGAVSPDILSHYSMSFRDYVDITVVANAIGAFSSLLAGLADRVGRANMITYGLLITALLVLFGIPNAPSTLAFGVLVGAVGFVEGIILVATPALVRDFSPQLGRASAMAFWTLGPVVGSLCVAAVSTNTLPHLHAWQDQFVICGIAGLVVFAVALLGLRELSPGLRDQLVVSARERALVEARAKGLQTSQLTAHPWRQMLHLDTVGPAFAVSVLLIIYYTAVGFFTIYFTTIFGFSLAQANGLGDWFWAFNAGALIVVGVLSDRLRVRKPFMAIGALGAIAFTILFLTRATVPTTSYGTFAWMISLIAICLAVAYAPWMAGYTESVERHNPALTATGLAIWGWVLRAVVAISVFILPFVVSSTTPLVDYGAAVAAASHRYAPELATMAAIDPKTLATLRTDPTNPQADATAIGEVATAFKVSPAGATARLIALETASATTTFAILLAHGAAVASALRVTPFQWQHWWWVCVGGELLFLALVFLMPGRWSSRRARADAAEHERLVDAELTALRSESPRMAA